jgi:hypothetical protein
MPMTKIDKARCIVMMTDHIRDVLLSNLDAMPEEWDGFEVRAAVLATCEGEISPIKPLGRRRAFEKAFFGGNFTRMKSPPDAVLDNDYFAQGGTCNHVISTRVGDGWQNDPVEGD